MNNGANNNNEDMTNESILASTYQVNDNTSKPIAAEASLGIVGRNKKRHEELKASLSVDLKKIKLTNPKERVNGFNCPLSC